MKKIKLLTLLSFVLLLYSNTRAQTAISSLAELKAELDTDNGNFKMDPGTYHFDTTNCGPGNLFSDPRLLLFTGNNSTFDFTGVKFEIDTEIFTLYGNIDIIEFWPVGSNNTYRNLTLEDIGMTVPTKGATTLHLDGVDNLVEGFKTTTRGSFPYGYGDTFGKGGGSVINHKKHAGILVRGDRNHLLNCTVLMRAYGHGIFVQGGRNTLIEGCYVEGELRTVGEVLAEEGTGSPADLVDFETVWGFNLRDLPSDYTFSLQEAGIRAYSTGVVHDENGNPTDETAWQTLNTTVTDCTIVKMRVGVNTGAEGGNAADGKRIENCTALACEGGFWLGNDGEVINCSADASVGPILSEDISRSNSTYEVTILDNYIPKIGNTPYFFAGGTNHNLTINDGTTYFNPDIQIVLGGTRYANRFLEGSSGNTPPTRNATNITLTNNTKYPLILENASNCTITSCGPVTDNGSGNSVTISSNCNYDRICDNTAENLQAECYDTMSGVTIANIVNGNNEKEVSNLHNGDWILFNDIDLTNMLSVEVIASSVKDDVALEVRQGSATGTVLGEISISNTGNYLTYNEFSTDLNQTVSGLTDVAFVATTTTADTGWLFKIDKISFVEDLCAVTYNPYIPIAAESFCDASGVTLEDRSIFNQAVIDIENNDYIKFSNVEFGYDDNYNNIEILASSSTSGGSIEIRSGSITGTLLATVDIESTGDSDNYEVFSNSTFIEITGTHDIYAVFKGSGASLFNVDNFFFNSKLHPDITGINNLALATNGGVASQSTTDYGGLANRANDGNTNGDWNGNSVSHTAHGAGGVLKWWQVDLGSDNSISKIAIYNRTSSSDNLNNFTVEIINDNDEIIFTEFFENYPSPVTVVNTDGAIGKIVKISKTSDRGIQLAEVGVFASNALSVNDNILAQQIKVYPNPAINEVTINNASGTTLEIYNINGFLESKLIITEDKKVIPLDKLNSGVHFLKFKNEQGLLVKKLVKK